MQGDEGDRNVKMAIENPDRFVVKPQREGGGTRTVIPTKHYLKVQTFFMQVFLIVHQQSQNKFPY